MGFGRRQTKSGTRKGVWVRVPPPVSPDSSIPHQKKKMADEEVNGKILETARSFGEEIKAEQLLTHESSFLREFMQIVIKNNLDLTLVVKENETKYLFGIQNLNNGKIELFRLWKTAFSNWDLEKDSIRQLGKVKTLSFYCLLGNISFPSRIYKEIKYSIRM